MESTHKPYYMAPMDDYPYWYMVELDELPEMYAEAIAFGYGSESTFADWLNDMERQGLLVWHD